MVQGNTDVQGLWYGDFTPIEKNAGPYTAVLGAPGDENFAVAQSSWNSGISSWAFGISQRMAGPRPKTYLYSDRPIYRPGQTVYFRGALRQGFDGRYVLPEAASVSLEMHDQHGRVVQTYDLPLSPAARGYAERLLALPAMREWYEAALAEPWREQHHEEEAAATGQIIEDLRWG